MFLHALALVSFTIPVSPWELNCGQRVYFAPPQNYSEVVNTQQKVESSGTDCSTEALQPGEFVESGQSAEGN